MNAMNREALQRMKDYQWRWAPHDPSALAILRQRLVDSARESGAPLTYSDLVIGVEFHAPHLNDGRGYFIDVHDWRPQDRELIGEFLGYLSMDSYERAGIIISALAVQKEDEGKGLPSEPFFKWMNHVGLLANLQESAKLAFWVNAFKEACLAIKGGRYG